MTSPTLTFWGAARTVTGSKFLVEHRGRRLLVDACCARRTLRHPRRSLRDSAHLQEEDARDANAAGRSAPRSR